MHLPEDVYPSDVTEALGHYLFFVYDELLTLLEGRTTFVG
jgi:hypothetical protein